MSYHQRCSGYKVTEAIEGKQHTLMWAISRFQSIRKCKYIRAYETEHVDHIQEPQFRLKIKLCGENKDLAKIYFLYSEHAVLQATFKISKGGPVGVATIINKKSFTVVANKWQVLVSLKKKTLFKFLCIFVDTLFMEFSFTVFTHIKHGPLLAEPDQLSNDLNNLLNSGMCSDVIVKSAEGEEFKVHKVILSSRSTVLKAHFAHDTLENKYNIVETHLDTDVLKEVLTYIYTDKAPRLQEMADALLSAADFYHLPGLKNMSAEILYLGLTKENTLETLQLADLHSATYLTELTLDFIKYDNLDVIRQSDKWKSLKSKDTLETLHDLSLHY